MNPYSVSKLPSDMLRETAEKHRKLRKQHKLTQAELARRSGVSLGSIKRFEQTGKISFESLLRLALILDRLGDFEKLFVLPVNMKEIEKLFSKDIRGL